MIKEYENCIIILSQHSIEKIILHFKLYSQKAFFLLRGWIRIVRPNPNYCGIKDGQTNWLLFEPF